MPNPINITNIPPPRVDFIDPRTGLIAREWYRFLFNQFKLTGSGTNETSLTDLQIGPPVYDLTGQIAQVSDDAQLAVMSDQAEVVLGQLDLVYDQAQLASMIAQYEQATLNLQNQFDTAPAAPQLGTIASYNLNGSPTAGGVGYGTGSAVAFTPAGTSGQFLTSAAAGAPTWTTPSSVAVTSFSAGTTGFTPSSATTGAVTLAGTLAVANGGTGTTSSTGSGSVVLSTSPTLVTPLLGTPTSGDFSTGTFTWPTFNQNTTGTAAGLSATLVATSGGTGQASYTTGDLLYASGGSTLSKLNIGANNYVLTSNGATPVWTANTGTGSVVRSNSPTLSFPVLGQASATSINFAHGMLKSAALVSTTTVADQVVDSFDRTIYRSAKFQIQAVCGAAFHITEIYVVHDDTNTYLTEYGIILTAGALATFDTAINGSFVELRATPANINTTFKIITTLISV